MLSPSNSVQELLRKYLENQLRVNSTPTRFRHSCLESTGGKRMRRIVFLLAFAVAAMAAVPRIQGQQRGAGLSQEVAAKRVATEKELESVAVIERKLLVPMRDGERMAADIYRPKDTSKKYPVIFVRTP